MFSGIVKKKAKLVTVDTQVGQTRFRVDLTGLIKNVTVDDSVAINGTCLTVVNIEKNIATFTAVPQTLAITNLRYLKTNDHVNIELSLRYGDVIGGHLLQGHVDTLVQVIDTQPIGDALQVTFSLPQKLRNYVIEKGYIGIDGMSLTVHTLKTDCFSVALIPHTRMSTVAQDYVVGSYVNLEVDMMAKYAENNWRYYNEYNPRSH